MKKTFTVFLLSVFLMGCGMIGKEDQDTSADGGGQVEMEVIDAQNITDVDDYVVSASSVFKDESGVGFDYEENMVLDQDFSTAWCASGSVNENISFSFSGPVLAENVGIVPGFARDETIYMQNNRVKSMDVFLYRGGEEVLKTSFAIPDEYKMHFFNLKVFDMDAAVPFDKIEFKITDVYDGSKYNDTCISEIDFWSDYVENEDADAAMNYYKKYKEDFALRPNDIVGAIKMSDRDINGCGEYSSPFNVEVEDGMTSLASDDLYAYGFVNEYGQEGDEIVIKWLKSGAIPVEEEGKDTEWIPDWFLNKTQTLAVEADCNGELYVSAYFDLMNDFENAFPYTPYGLWRVQLYRDGRIIGIKEFVIEHDLN